MTRPDIIRRAFRGTWVGIAIDGRIKNFLRLPDFETYVPPERKEDHILEVLTEKEIQKLMKKEIKKKKKAEVREKENRKYLE